MFFIVFSLMGCDKAKYKVGDTVYVDGTEFKIITVRTSVGSGASYGGVNYECEYKDSFGVFHTKTVYEKEIVNTLIK